MRESSEENDPTPASAESWGRMARSCPIGLVVVDCDRRVCFCNAAADRMLAICDQGLPPAIPLERDARCEIETPGPDGPRTVRCAVAPEQDDDDANWLVTITDITADRRAIRQANELNRMLEQRLDNLGHLYSTSSAVVKQLNCLHAVSAMLNRHDATLDEKLQTVAELLPAACDTPDLAVARIVVDDDVFGDGQFEETEWRLAAEITARGDRIGSLQVCYLEPPREEGEAFVPEERNLLHSIANRLGLVIAEQRAQEALQRAHDELEQRVRERTRELSDANTRLTAEIEQRRRVGTALQASEERLRTLINSMPDVVCFKDGRGRWLEANDAALRAASLDGVAYRGCTDAELSTECPTHRRTFLSCSDTDERAWEQARVWRTEEVVAGGDMPTSVYDVLKLPLYHPDGRRKGLLILGRDITDHKRAEREKQEMQKQLLQAQKMEAIGTLAGGVAHDFNNLLTVINGFTDLAIRSIDEPHPLYNTLQPIRKAAKQATGLTRQLLLFSRKQVVELSAVDINDTVENLLKMLQRLIGEDVSVRTDLVDQPWAVLADEGNLEQVVMNLAVNARDAMPDGGVITVATENVTVDDALAAEVPEARSGRFLRLSVADTGVGMSEEVVQRIFEPFFTTKGEGKGTGLGLAVVYGIVKQHDGWLKVESTPEEGTTFQVYLPVVEDPAAGVEEERDAPFQAFRGNGETVLVVEDDDIIRSFARMALEECGYHVVDVGSASAAMKAFNDHYGTIALVFSDVVLADENGLNLVDRFMIQDPHVKVLLSSGYTDQKARLAQIRERGIPFLQKPYPLNDLLKTVQELVAEYAAAKA